MTRPPVWSPSRLGVALACDRRYNLRYRDRAPADTTNLWNAAGNRFHEGAEDLGRRWLEHGPFDVSASIEAAVEARCASERSDAEQTALALEHARKAAGTPSLDFSDLAFVEQNLLLPVLCPMCEGRSCDACRCVGGDDPTRCRTHDAPIDPEDDADRCPHAGTILARARADRVDLPDDHRVTVVDYKTGRDVKTRDELAVDPQATVLAAAARAMWPDREVTVAFWFVGRPWPVTFDWDGAVDATARGFVRVAHRRWWAEEQERRDDAPASDETCRYCPYRDGCDAYQEMVAGRRLDGPKGAPTPEALADLLASYARARDTEKAAKDRKGELAKRLLPLVSRGRVSGGGYVGYLREDHLGDYPALAPVARVIARFSGQHPDDVAAELAVVGKKRLDAKIDAVGAGLDEDARAALDAAVKACGGHRYKRYPRVDRAREVF